MQPDVGHVIANKYELRRLVGEGGMGQVWAARHVSLEQTVAIKLMTPPAPDSGEDSKTALRRFQIEAQVAAELSRKSRHIVRVSDHGEEDGVAYLVMELLDGETLDQAIDGMGRLSAGYVTAIMLQAAKGVSAAHAEGVTHRDLKPGNIFLSRDEDGALLVKILDFGIARLARRVEPASSPARAASAPTRLTIRGMVLGSSDYMSPEQALAHRVDPRADVWSLAVVAFEALTGARPFSEPSVEQTLARICAHRDTKIRALLLDAPAALEEVFTKAFAPRIEDRFQTAEELARALEAVAPATRPVLVRLGARQGTAAPPTAPPTATANLPPVRSSWPVALGAGALAGIVAIAAFVALKGSHGPAASAPSASSAVTVPSAEQTPSASAPVPTVATPVVSVDSLRSSRPTSRNKTAPSAVPAPPASTAGPPATAVPSAKPVDKGAIF